MTKYKYNEQSNNRYEKRFQKKIDLILKNKGYQSVYDFLHEVGLKEWQKLVDETDTEKLNEFCKDIYLFLLALNAISDPSLEEIISQTKKHVEEVLIPLEQGNFTSFSCF